jgi:hypothetical protein
MDDGTLEEKLDKIREVRHGRTSEQMSEWMKRQAGLEWAVPRRRCRPGMDRLPPVPV